MEWVRYSIFLLKKTMSRRTNECSIMPTYSQTDDFTRMPCKKQYTNFCSDRKPKHFIKPAHLSTASSHLQLLPEKQQRIQGIQEHGEICKIHSNLIWTGAYHLHSSGKNFSAVCLY